MNARKLFTIVLALLVFFLLPAQVRKTEGATTNTTTRRVSVASDGTQANSDSFLTSISADGRYIAFPSHASNLVGGDTNGYLDVFVHDMQTGQTTRVSVATNGMQSNGESNRPSISADGRFVAFHSGASNLVPGDTNGKYDIFIHDMQTGQTTRVSVASDGTEGNNDSYDPAISANGRYIAFASIANNLVGGDTNVWSDIFVHDMVTGQTTRISVASNGTEGNGNSGGGEHSSSISADGRYIAFESTASNLVVGDTFGCPGYTPSCPDIFVHDTVTGQTIRVSVASDGTQGNGETHFSSMSSDGRYVAFVSWANNLVSGDTNNRDDIFIHDMQTGQTTRVSVASDGTEGNGSSIIPSISADGRYVVFESGASNLVSGDTNSRDDVFVHNIVTGQTIRVSVATDGTQGNGASRAVSISANGRYVAFSSAATNLVINDANGAQDIFVHDQGGDSYSISGRVTDGTNGISGVTINWTGGSTVTDASGYYTTNVITGSYTISASKGGYTFLPISRTTTVPPSKTGQDFVGYLVQQGCGVPFLSQRDGRWNNYPLRGMCSASCNTIGACGCTLVAATMIFNYYDAALTPPALSDCLGNQACPFSWSTGATCTSGKVVWVNKWPFTWNQLDREINQNKRPVVLGMHRKSNPGSTHWVTVISGQGNDPSNYTMHDPWFLGGANTNLAVRSKDYNFDWIASYSGQPSCPASPLKYAPKSAPSQKRSAAPNAVVTGNVWIYSVADTTMTLLMVAKSDVANVIEMQIWTDVMPSTWQPFATLITVPLGDPIHARFRDELGNVSDIYTDSIYPVSSPPKEVEFKIFLPIILK